MPCCDGQGSNIPRVHPRLLTNRASAVPLPNYARRLMHSCSGPGRRACRASYMVSRTLTQDEKRQDEEEEEEEGAVNGNSTSLDMTKTTTCHRPGIQDPSITPPPPARKMPTTRAYTEREEPRMTNSQPARNKPSSIFSPTSIFSRRSLSWPGAQLPTTNCWWAL